MKGVILQPSYIPWRGYFHQILKADVFVFYDDVQYDKHGWRNRNRVKTHQGPVWLTIPVYKKGVTVENIPIQAIEIDWRSSWNKKHWMTLKQAYGKAPYFKRYATLLEEFYTRHDQYLAELDIAFTLALAKEIGIAGTQFLKSSDLDLPHEIGQKISPTGHLVQILQTLGVTHYITGPAAKDYIETKRFEEKGITLEYMHYTYPEYPQLYPPYDPQVSILDLLFMVGPKAIDYIYRPLP